MRLPAPDVLVRLAGANATIGAQKSNTVWTFNGHTVAPAAVTTGITDSVSTEILTAPFGEGTPVVTRMAPTTTP